MTGQQIEILVKDHTGQPATPDPSRSLGNLKYTQMSKPPYTCMVWHILVQSIAKYKAHQDILTKNNHHHNYNTHATHATIR